MVVNGAKIFDNQPEENAFLTYFEPDYAKASRKASVFWLVVNSLKWSLNNILLHNGNVFAADYFLVNNCELHVYFVW